jgi:hypothetical protein
MGDARYREYSWYEEYRSRMIQIHGGFQKTSRRLQQMNLVDTYRAEMTKEANNTLVSKIKQLKAHYGITVSEAVCNICNQVDQKLNTGVTIRLKTMRTENLSLRHSRGRVT